MPSRNQAPPAVDRRREVTARLSYVPRGAEYAGKVAGNAKYLGRKQAVDRGEADEGHERYLAREGPFFTASSDGVKAGQVAEACRNDPRQFRLIVAPEDGERMTAAEMKAFIREYMARVERAVGARLGWAAVIHKADNVARENARHAHVIIRGRDLDGNVLRFAKPFVKDGFRTIARELTTEKLGPLNDRELDRQRQQRGQHKDRNREWKRLEREGATMAQKRAFTKEGRTRACCQVNCRGLHLSALRLALIGRFGLRLGETIRAVRLTLGDPGRTFCETGLRSSAPAHA